MVRSAPRRPTTNGLIEREHRVLQDRLLGWMGETGRTDWAAALAEIQWKRNNEWTRVLSMFKRSESEVLVDS